ncbi:unnamed protein product [marine sediment metagenome]|uniref:Uncharacterized protein n=1 Tax=marine sediment metagenome TaxID=412755 RepID=X1V775_9ZZZZ
MPEIFNLIVTAIIAVLVFITGQIILKFVIEPIQNLNKFKGELTHTLTFYMAYITNPTYDSKADDATKAKQEKKIEEVFYIFRDLACEILKLYNVIPRYNFWRKPFNFIVRDNPLPESIVIQKVHRDLIFLSNSIHITENQNEKMRENNKRIDKIINEFNLKIRYPHFEPSQKK